jgi:N-glycosylase/DNA lyase
MVFPAEYAAAFVDWQPQIQRRLVEFANVPESAWFYELCYCILTPQSKAVHADAVVRELKDSDFFRRGTNPESMLRNPATYIRFHHQKAQRLLRARELWDQYQSLITAATQPTLSVKDRRHMRDQVAQTVEGFGMKEASHFLRNIGVRQLGILDRHILRYLVLCDVYPSLPAISSVRAYRQVEESFDAYAAHIGRDMDELDLFFWSQTTGFILK